MSEHLLQVVQVGSEYAGTFHWPGDRGPIAIWTRLRSLTLRCNLTMFISGHDISSTSLALNQAPPSISEGLIFNTPTSLLPSWPPGVSAVPKSSASVLHVVLRITRSTVQ